MLEAIRRFRLNLDQLAVDLSSACLELTGRERWIQHLKIA